jgi:hypothetical protein
MAVTTEIVVQIIRRDEQHIRFARLRRKLRHAEKTRQQKTPERF